MYTTLKEAGTFLALYTDSLKKIFHWDQWAVVELKDAYFTPVAIKPISQTPE